MFVQESELLKKILDRISLKPASRILDIGSSSIEFRTVIQPHLDKNVFKPLRDKGYIIHHLDKKKEVGVDICMNLTKVMNSKKIIDKYDLILCTNILEHVENRDIFLNNLLRFADENTLILFTVPKTYFKHNDPIDTMYRPTPKQLTNWLKQYLEIEILFEDILEITEKRYYSLKKRPFRYFPIKYPVFMWRYYIKLFRWKVTFVLFVFKKYCNP